MKMRQLTGRMDFAKTSVVRVGDRPDAIAASRFPKPAAWRLNSTNPSRLETNTAAKAPAGSKMLDTAAVQHLLPCLLTGHFREASAKIWSDRALAGAVS